MEKQFLTCEQSLRLKTLGFNEPCFGYYVDGELRGINLGIEEMGGFGPYYKRFGFHTIKNSDVTNMNKIIATAPLRQQAFDWFRNKYRLSHIIYDLLDDYEATVIEWTLSEDKIVHEFPQRKNIEYPNNRFDSWDEAETACIIKIIDIIIQNIFLIR